MVSLKIHDIDIITIGFYMEVVKPQQITPCQIWFCSSQDIILKVTRNVKPACALIKLGMLKHGELRWKVYGY